MRYKYFLKYNFLFYNNHLNFSNKNLKINLFDLSNLNLYYFISFLKFSRFLNILFKSNHCFLDFIFHYFKKVLLKFQINLIIHFQFDINNYFSYIDFLFYSNF